MQEHAQRFIRHSSHTLSRHPNFDWPRPPPIFQATAQPCSVNLGFHSTTSECRSSNSAAFNNPAKRIIEPAQIINPACLHRASSCHIPTNSPKTHQTLIKQQIHKSIIHSLENPNPNSNNWHSTIQWAATPNPTTAPAPAPAAPATRPSPTDITTSKPACKSSAS